MRPLHHLLPILAMSLVALGSSSCYGGVNARWPAVRPERPPRLTRSGSQVGTSVLPPSGAQVATDRRPHRVRVYRSPEWDPRTTARVELALMGGVMTATFVTLGRWDWDGLCRAFVNAADDATPIVAGTPFTWLGMKRNRWFRDWCQSYYTQGRVASTARAWLPDRFAAHARLGGLTHSLRP